MSEKYAIKILKIYLIKYDYVEPKLTVFNEKEDIIKKKHFLSGSLNKRLPISTVEKIFYNLSIDRMHFIMLNNKS